MGGIHLYCKWMYIITCIIEGGYGPTFWVLQDKWAILVRAGLGRPSPHLACRLPRSLPASPRSPRLARLTSPASLASPRSPRLLPSVFHSHYRLRPVCASARAAGHFTGKSCVNIGEAVTHWYAEWVDNASVPRAFGQTRCVQTETLPHNHSQTHVCLHAWRQ